ncbi:transporter substrate-binding domain-containing protein [Streptomyces sp. p1417]|uniref:Transporter substrate-binding domain-containing protein n=1 Tax=Streptomyces typhae TaxID=2681492 RepID=A0A6L6X977_9ACTN|nr:transporter substrate-binding domain-containing protein [Streptomyces typhae]
MEPLRRQDPKRLGEFTLLARLGSGGMGRVYLGRSPGGMQLAIKVIREDLAEEADVLTRFRREVDTVRAVRSPYTARLVSARLDSPPYWLATEFVPGPTLLKASRGAALEPALCRGLFAALAEALAAVHAHGVVHRDVKPHNVILAPGGPQLIDFGIARTAEHTQLTRTGQMPGTPGYTAPEVLLGSEAGPAADVFALGATIAAAATGRPPYGGGEWPAVIYRVVHGEIDLDGVEPALAELIRQCVAREPAQRPDPPEIVRRCGTTYALAQFPPYQRLGEATPTLAPPQRRRIPWAATAALTVAGVALGTLGWTLSREDDGATADDSPAQPTSSTPTASSTPTTSGPGSQKKRKSLTIGVVGDRPGMGTRTQDGTYQGFDIDVARYVAGRLGVKKEDITWREAPAAERTSLLRRGEVDFVVATFAITAARKAEVDFTKPYLSARQDLLLRTAAPAPDMTALDGKKLCSVLGTTSTQVMREKAPGASLVEYPSYARCLDALDDGQVDAVTADDSLLAGYAAQRGKPGDYQLAGLELGGDSLYGVGVPKGQKELRDDIDTAIDQMIADGSWAKSATAHLGGVINYDAQPPARTTTTSTTG